MYKKPKVIINSSDWPSNYGCYGKEIDVTLYKGQYIDRFGSENGFFLGIAGEPYIYRSLPWFGNYTANDILNNNKIKKSFYKFYSEPNTNNPEYDYHLYKVVKTLSVKSCKIGPAFGFPGGGTQYRSDNNVNELIQQGFIKEVPWSDSPLFDDSNIMGGRFTKFTRHKYKKKLRRNSKQKTTRKIKYNN
jgi:hypothetical protein